MSLFGDSTSEAESEAPFPEKPAEPAKIKAPRRVIRKLDSELLLSDSGFPSILRESSKIKFKGKGHEASDLKKLLNYYHLKFVSLCPDYTREATFFKVEKTCKERIMKGFLAQILRDERNERLGVSTELEREEEIDEFDNAELFNSEAINFEPSELVEPSEAPVSEAFNKRQALQKLVENRAKTYQSTDLFQLFSDSIPGQFDDPNETVSRIVATCKELKLNGDYSVAKLRQGHGDSTVQLLLNLANAAISKQHIKLKKPTFKHEDRIEEAQVNEEAEIITETFQESSDDEQDAIYKSASKFKSPSKDLAAPILSKEQFQDWKLQVERVAPLLKVQLNRLDWRVHLEQLNSSTRQFNSFPQLQMNKLTQEISSTIDKIQSRETYLSAQFEKEACDHRELQEQLSLLKQTYSESSSELDTLNSEFAQVSEKLEICKEKMDEIGNGMTDAKPLVNIKQAIVNLRNEIKQMDLRMRVIETSLVYSKLKRKTNYFNDKHSKLSFLDLHKLSITA